MYYEHKEKRNRVLAAITVCIGIVLFILIIIGLIISGQKTLSPVPEENVIRIIYMTPSPTVPPTPTVTPTPTKKPR